MVSTTNKIGLSLLVLICLLVSLIGASRTVLVVSNLIDDVSEKPLVEVYDFLSRTWRVFEPPKSVNSDSLTELPNVRKPHAARLINHESLLELDLKVPSMKTANLPPNIDGGAPFYYGDTLCLAGGYNTNTSELLQGHYSKKMLEK